MFHFPCVVIIGPKEEPQCAGWYFRITHLHTDMRCQQETIYCAVFQMGRKCVIGGERLVDLHLPTGAASAPWRPFHAGAGWAST